MDGANNDVHEIDADRAQDQLEERTKTSRLRLRQPSSC